VDGDDFFSSDMLLLVGVLLGFLVLFQSGVVATVGEWLGNLMMNGAPVP
jgi:hypothetical protein